VIVKRAPAAMSDPPAGAVPVDQASLRIVESPPFEQAAADSALGEWLLPDLHRRVCRIEQILELVPILLAQVVDPTHLSVEGAARALHTSTKTIRRRIKSGTLALEVIPGTRASGIPIDQLYAEWIDLRTARAAFERECRARRS
jgi:hypothetical protein